LPLVGYHPRKMTSCVSGEIYVLYTVYIFFTKKIRRHYSRHFRNSVKTVTPLVLLITLLEIGTFRTLRKKTIS